MPSGLFGQCQSFYGKCGEYNTSFYERNGNTGGIPDFSIPTEESLFTNYDEIDPRLCSCAPFNPDNPECDIKCNCNKT